MDFRSNNEWLLRSLDLSTSSTNDANWFWSSKGGIFILIFNKSAFVVLGKVVALFSFIKL